MTDRGSWQVGSWVLVLYLAGWLHPASAQPIAPLLACRAVADPAARLACFDRESATLAGEAAPASSSPVSATASPVSPAMAAAAARPARSAPRATEEFGLSEGAVAAREVAAGTRPTGVDHIEARVTKLSSSGNGLLVFTLDNGQVWKQLLHEGELLASVGDSVRISRGWLGSYAIRLPSGRGCKVERVR